MSYTTVEILSGVLVVACLMLLWCQRSNNVDGLAQKRNGYSSMQPYGSFAREGYVVGHPGDNSLSYTARSSHFTDNMENKGLNELTTTPTPPSNDKTTPPMNVNRKMWLSEANINNHQFTADEEIEMHRNIFARQVNSVKEASETLSGATLQLVDYGANMIPTRQVTM